MQAFAKKVAHQARERQKALREELDGASLTARQKKEYLADLRDKKRKKHKVPNLPTPPAELEQWDALFTRDWQEKLTQAGLSEQEFQKLSEINNWEIIKTNDGQSPMTLPDGTVVAPGDQYLDQNARANKVAWFDRLIGEQAGLKQFLEGREMPLATSARDLLDKGIEKIRKRLKEFQRERDKLVKKIQKRLKRIAERSVKLEAAKREVERLRDRLDRKGKHEPSKAERKDLEGAIRRAKRRAGELREAISGDKREMTVMSGRHNLIESELIPETEQVKGEWTTERSRVHDAITLYSSGESIPQRIRDTVWQVQSLAAERAAALAQTPQPPAPRETAAPGPSESDAEKSRLLEEQLQEERKRTALSQAQYGTFRDFFAGLSGGLPFLGAFATGGGPMPSTGLALLHKGEHVIPADPGGGIPMVVNLTLAGESAQLVRLVDARIDGRAAKVTDKQLGRRARTIAVAPGR